MRLAVHLFRVVVSSMRYAVSLRSPSLILVVVLGLVMVALGVTVTAAAPVVLYPFI